MITSLYTGWLTFVAHGEEDPGHVNWLSVVKCSRGNIFLHWQIQRRVILIFTLFTGGVVFIAWWPVFQLVKIVIRSLICGRWGGVVVFLISLRGVDCWGVSSSSLSLLLQQRGLVVEHQTLVLQQLSSRLEDPFLFSGVLYGRNMIVHQIFVLALLISIHTLKWLILDVVIVRSSLIFFSSHKFRVHSNLE